MKSKFRAHAGMAALLLTALLALSACQSYQEKPLDLDAAKRERQARSLDDAAFQRYLSQLHGWGGANELLPPPSFQEEGGITRWEAEAICLFFSPDLRQARIASGIPLAEAEEAGRLDNPSLGLDVKHILENISNPWVIGASIGFTFPLSNRLELEKQALLAEHGVAIARVLEAEWAAVAELRRLWAQRSVLAQRKSATRAVIAEVEDLARIARALRDAGALSVVDARIFEIQLATLENDLADLENADADLRVQVLARMGLLPNAEVQLQHDYGEIESLPREQREARLESHSPLLNRLRAEHAAAEKAFELEIEKQYPDFGLGGGYENEAGTGKVGLGLGIPLPFFDLNQQAIAKTRAAREATFAAYNAGWEQQINQLAVELQRVKLARDQVRRLDQSIAPILETQLADLQRLAKLGQIDALLTLDVLVRRHELRQRVITSQAQMLDAQVEISVLSGPKQESLSPAGSTSTNPNKSNQGGEE